MTCNNGMDHSNKSFLDVLSTITGCFLHTDVTQSYTLIHLSKITPRIFTDSLGVIEKHQSVMLVFLGV